MSELYDIAIIGGGINGCGLARDATGRGLKVFLCERDDLGGATSAASTKLLHGGLRYLEHYEFRLVREALKEREILWGIAPHIVRPLRFVLPQAVGMRPAWLLRLGLFLYDHLGGRDLLPGTAVRDLSGGPLGQGLRPELRRGYEYSDCWVEDNRLVILNARAAARAGATIMTRTSCLSARAVGGRWTLTLEDRLGGRNHEIQARILVNAAGPWATGVAADIARHPPKGRTRLVQGSHIVVRRLYDHDRCFIFQNGDGRIVFTIPYEGDFTLIGTTDRDYAGPLDSIKASDDEIDYLCKAVSGYFRQPVAPADVVWSYSGVRPLYDDGTDAAQKATRDYTLELDVSAAAPLLSVFGGKITTYRRLAESALDRLAPHFEPGLRDQIAARRGWTGRVCLPGGDFHCQGFAGQVAALATAHPFLTPEQAVRMTRFYGTEALAMLAGARDASALGRDFGAGLTEAELDHMQRNEWALTAEDVLWRRSKLGLRLDRRQVQAIRDSMSGLMTAA